MCVSQNVFTYGALLTCSLLFMYLVVQRGGARTMGRDKSACHTVVIDVGVMYLCSGGQPILSGVCKAKSQRPYFTFE